MEGQWHTGLSSLYNTENVMRFSKDDEEMHVLLWWHMAFCQRHQLSLRLYKAQGTDPTQHPAGPAWDAECDLPFLLQRTLGYLPVLQTK